MLERILEPEVMDSASEAEDYDAMDHAEVNRRFVAESLEFGVGRGGLMLDLGTGTAQIPIEYVRQCPEIRVLAIDRALAMLRVARRNLLAAKCEVQLLGCDAKSLPITTASVRAVVSNSIVHHIPDPTLVFAEVMRIVQPGGYFFVRDLARPESSECLEAIVNQYACDANVAQRRMFADSLHAALTLNEVREIIHKVGGTAAQVTMTSDRHWTWAGRKLS